ncbi:MAG: DUF4080 domain-containing protein [Desulfuromonadales bacterium]|nr:DUF4080 domain-containing protein [Desulfuromonadales bacterium]
MKIVLATLHVRRSAQAVPLAAGCLTAALPEEQQVQTRLIDLFAHQSLEEMARLILAEDPDLVAFPTYVWNRAQVISLSHSLHLQHPELVLAAGGPEATGDYAKLASEAPWLILLRGEGEVGFTRLIEALSRKEPLESLPNITVMRNGQISIGPEQPPAEDLSAFPSPWLTGILTPGPDNGVLWEISRGCAFSCDYCFDSRGQEGVRELNWKRLEAELDFFVDSGVSQVWVLDSTFNFPPERGLALLELLLEKAPQIHYHIEAKIEFLNRQIIHLLGQLSCSVQFGLQSTNAEALKAVHRPLDLEHLSRQIHLLEAEGVIYGFDLIYGLPSDNYDGFRQSLDAALGFSPNHVHLFRLSVLPGTRLARQKDRHGLIAQDDPPYEIISSTSWSADDLQKSRLLAEATNLFYNSGRAVAFFPAILKVLQVAPSTFFEDFCEWAITQGHIDPTRPAKDEKISAHEAYQLQQDYLQWRLQKNQQAHLVTALLDLLSYHYHYAETLLGYPVEAAPGQTLLDNDLWETSWQSSSRIRLVPFTYEIVDLMEMEEIDLNEFTGLFRPVGSVALFFRRDGEVNCESLGEDFLRLLQGSDGSRCPREIFAGTLPRASGEELVSFAVTEGLLQKRPA